MSQEQLIAKVENLLAVLRGEMMPGLSPELALKLAAVQTESILKGLRTLAEVPHRY